MNVEQKLLIVSVSLAELPYWRDTRFAGVSSDRSRSPGARGRRKKGKAQKVARRLNR